MIETNLMYEWPDVLAHLMRGGRWGYYWCTPGKLSCWWPVDSPMALPGDAGRRDWYFGVHPSTTQRGFYGRSMRDTIAAVNALFAEFDAKDFGGQLMAALRHLNGVTPAATVVICSGGGWHAYWLLERPFVIGNDEDREYIDELQKRWVDHTGGDTNAKDLARMLRVPGTVNYKPQYGPDFPAVRLVRVNWDKLYTLHALESALPEPERVYVPAPTIWDRVGGAPSLGHDKISWAEALLEQLHPWRADDYDEWVRVGMTLGELGEEGLYLWDRWSRQSPKWKAGVCEKKRRTFGVGGVSLGTLYHLARQDDDSA